MRVFASLISILCICGFLSFQQARAQDCLTLDDYREYAVGECVTVIGPEEAQNTGCIVAYEEVPGMAGTLAYRYEAGSGHKQWSNIDGNQVKLYRECQGTSCWLYNPPWVAWEFPMCLDSTWTPQTGYTRTVTAVNRQVIVPAGTFEGCVEIELKQNSPEKLLILTYMCPCVREAKAIDYRTNPAGDVWELKEYDICSDLDGDFDGHGDLVSTCDPSSACGGDCDDSNELVHPGAIEGPMGSPTCSDGWDNDCDGGVDASFPDWDTDCVTWAFGGTQAVASISAAEASSTNVVNYLTLLLLPVGAVIFLRIVRRKR